MGWRNLALGTPGIGAQLKERAGKIGPWLIFVAGFGEMLPNPDNRVTLHKTRTDKWGVPILHIECEIGQNEHTMAKHIIEDGKAMVEAAGGMVISTNPTPATMGSGIHEMGTACMGKDPKKSVLNKYNQVHDVKNVFITDGAAMASSGCQNPSLTYMALSARAAHHAVQFMKEGML